MKRFAFPRPLYLCRHKAIPLITNKTENRKQFSPIVRVARNALVRRVIYFRVILVI